MMKKLLALALAMLMAISLAACGDNDTAVPMQNQPKASSESEPSSPKNNSWVGVYESDGITIEITEPIEGTLHAEVMEEMLLDSDLTVSGSTATGSVTVKPEAQGGDMTLEGARDRFPDCLYEFTLTVDGMSMRYSRVLILIDTGNNDRPEQTMEFSAELTKITQNSK